MHERYLVMETKPYLGFSGHKAEWIVWDSQQCRVVHETRARLIRGRTREQAEHDARTCAAQLNRDNARRM